MKNLLLIILVLSLSLAVSGYAFSYIYTCSKISANAQLVERLYNNPNILNPFVHPTIKSNAKRLLENLADNSSVLNIFVRPVTKGNSQLIERLYNNPNILNPLCADKK